MTQQALVAMVGITLLGSALFLSLPGLRRAPPGVVALVVGAMSIVLLVPVGGLPIGGYIRGVTGDFSITSMVVALAFIGAPRKAGAPSALHDRRVLWAFLTLIALALYPMTLGLTLADPYRLGYGEPWFVGVLLLVAGLAWLRGSVRVTVVIALAILAWVAGLLESTNLWDYLVDPFIAAFAIARTAAAMYRRLRAPPVRCGADRAA